jgi:hypothetical protein
VNDDQQVRNAVQELTQLKKNIKETMHSYIIQDILRTRTSLTLQDGTPIPNRRMDDLCEVWSNNAGMAECMWNVLIKWYEDIGEWELTFEKEVMDSLSLEYVEENDGEQKLRAESKDKYGNVTKVIQWKKSRIRGNKGCIAKVATQVKRDIIEQFNRASSATHGLTITSVNPVITADDDGKKNMKNEK